MDPNIALVGIGFFSLLLGLGFVMEFKGLVFKRNAQTGSKVTASLLSILGTFLILAGLFRLFTEDQEVTVIAEQEPAPSPAGTVVFTVPLEGDSVDHEQEVRGRAIGIPHSRDLWIVVRPISSGAFHPQPGAVPVGAGGEYETIAFIGASQDANIGERFLLIAVTTSRQGSQEFQAYLEQTKRDQIFPGLPALPSDAEILSQITVVRR